MSKSTHFFGQSVYGQLTKTLDHDKIVEISRQNGGERYVKSFDGFSHLPSQVADRVSFQADKAEFPTTLLLRRERQRHQDTNMGHAHCQSIALPTSKLLGKAVEFLRAGNYGAHCAYGIPQHE